MKKNDQRIAAADLNVFKLTMIGGSDSGKTTFMSAVCQMLSDKGVRINGLDKNGDKYSYKFHLEPVKYDVGDTADKLNEDVDVTSQPPQKTSPMSAGAGGGGGAFGRAVSGITANAGRNVGRVMHYDAYSAEGAERTAIISKIQGELQRRFEIRPASSGNESDFRDGTDKMIYTEICFEILLDDDVIGIMYITDYGGEFIDRPGEGGGDEIFSKLIDHIYHSDGAVVLANVLHLSEHVAESYDAGSSMFNEVNVRTGISADGINNLIRALRDKEDFTFVTALTASDSPNVDVRVSENGYKRAMNDLKRFILEGSFSCAQYRDWSTALIPVSAIGRKSDHSPNVDRSGRILPDAEIHPEGVDKAIMFCIYNAALAKKTELDSEYTALKKKLFKGRDEKRRYEGVTARIKKLDKLIDVLQMDKDDMFRDLYEPVYAHEHESEVGTVRRVR
ncbi:MAG: hypothetical protein II695_04620 [Oscillospiraceae bacterium]|nr:hypothetical protein [Oscillospiraceae bacterium]